MPLISGAHQRCLPVVVGGVDVDVSPLQEELGVNSIEFQQTFQRSFDLGVPQYYQNFVEKSVELEKSVEKSVELTPSPAQSSRGPSRPRTSAQSSRRRTPRRHGSPLFPGDAGWQFNRNTLA